MKKIIVTPDTHTQLITQDDALGKMAREVSSDLIESEYQAFIAESMPVPIGIPMQYMDFGYKSLRNKVGVRTTPKVKRNEPCPCGSGLKAKKCKCMRIDNDL